MRIPLVILVICFFTFVKAQKKDVINVLILQATDFHDMSLQATTFKEVLESTGNYDIRIILASQSKNWYDHNFQLSDYQLIVSSGFGIENVPHKYRNDLSSFVKEGGGLVIVHQGVASFKDWSGFQKMIGKGWYGSHTGPYTFWDDESNTWIETPIFHGMGPAHGKQHEMVIDIRNKEHPITKGMPSSWMHGMDEFYHGMRGSTENMEILATAYSDKDMWGSGRHEPIAWTSSYGSGRVFATILGHVFKEENANDIPGINSTENGTQAIYCIGFQTLFARGAEWAATGAVTVGIPSNFPTNDESVITHPNEIKWQKKVSNKK